MNSFILVKTGFWLVFSFCGTIPLLSAAFFCFSSAIRCLSSAFLRWETDGGGWLLERLNPFFSYWASLTAGQLLQWDSCIILVHKYKSSKKASYWRHSVSFWLMQTLKHFTINIADLLLTWKSMALDMCMLESSIASLQNWHKGESTDYHYISLCTSLVDNWLTIGR